jgi:hypothetical protein
VDVKYQGAMYVIGCSKIGKLLLSAERQPRVRAFLGTMLATVLYLLTLRFAQRPMTLLQQLGLFPIVLLIGGFVGYFVRLVLAGGAIGAILGACIAGIRGEGYLETIAVLSLLTALLVAAIGDLMGDARLPHCLWVQTTDRDTLEA